jgi:hypothetical protein
MAIERYSAAVFIGGVAIGGILVYRIFSIRYAAKLQEEKVKISTESYDFWRDVFMRTKNKVDGEDETDDIDDSEASAEDDEDEDEDDEDDEMLEEADAFVEHRSDPYVIRQDEFMANESEFDQTSYTYYSVDGFIADQRDEIIEPSVVGVQNLDLFGHLSDDENIVCVRNEKLRMEIEIVRHLGSYREVVLGGGPG